MEIKGKMQENEKISQEGPVFIQREILCGFV